MVDASIIVVENVHKRLETWEEQGRPEPRHAVVVEAMQEVGPSIFYSLLVLTVSFLPVFALQGTEGRLFRPLASTKTFSMGFAALLAVTLTPALAVLLIRGRVHREEDNPINRGLVRLYEPVVRAVVRRRRLVVGLAVLVVLATIPAWLALQTEFMPPLNEGTLLYMPTAPPGMSATQATEVVQAMDREIAAFPEVLHVMGKMGRAETATDPAPLDMAETVVVLKPREAWREGMTWERLVGELDRTVRYPGMPNLWWMPIQTRTEMLATGVRTPLAAQVFGPDLAAIEQASIAVERAVATIPGTRSAYAERTTGGFFLDVDVDREAAARYGLRVEDVQMVVETAIGGMSIDTVLAGRARYPVSVRLARDFREDPDALARVPVPTRTGAQVPLGQVAHLVFRTGPPMIRSEGGQLTGFVFVDPGESPIGDYVREARRRVAEVALPPGTRVDWTGQFEYLERATQRLRIVLPVTLLLVVLLLWLNTRSVVETAIILLAVPFSIVGAVWLLWALDYHLSVAVWVGIIALAGLDAETGVVMLLYLTLAHDRHAREGRLRDDADLTEAIVEGAARRIRPKLMTVATAMIGLLPIMWSQGTGADVMRRIAAPMIGGLVTSFLLELTVYPAVFAIWKGRGVPPAARAA
jgi:Cu(I)/Ag(I) efflux system membrane protein CusA/SilA